MGADPAHATAVQSLADRIRSEADVAARPGQFDRLCQLAEEVERITVKPAGIDTEAWAAPCQPSATDPDAFEAACRRIGGES